ncbi:Phage portal protein [compost metagenome]
MSWLDNLPWGSRRKVKLTEPTGWGIDTAWAGHSVTADTALQRGAAWACVRLNARTVGSLPLKVYQKTPDGKRRAATEHPLHALINSSPNAEQTAMEFWEGQATALNLRGFSYAEKKKLGGRLVALVPLDPDRVSVYRTPAGVRRYRVFSRTGEPRDLGEDDIFHLRGFGAGGDNGLSPIGYGRQTLSAAGAADEVASRTFASGLQLAGFVEDQPGAKTTNDQRKDLIELFDKFSGSRRAGKVLPLPPGFSFKPLNMSPEDAQLLETRRFNIEEICRWFGVFPILIGHAADGQTMWGSGVEQINLAWLTLYLGPELQRIEQAIEKQLLSAVDRAKGFYVEFNVDALLRADSAARATLMSAQAQNGLKTRNELRALDNDPPMPGGDVLTVQSNLVPLDQLGKVPPRAVQPAPGEPI